MSYEDIVEAQSKRDTKSAGVGSRTQRGKCETPVTPASASLAVKRSRGNEVEDARREIKAAGWGSIYARKRHTPIGCDADFLSIMQ
jgi:hypothetical protein